jgi:hypothetical protein
MIRDPLAVFMKEFAEDEELVFEWQTGDDEDETETLTCRGIFDNSFVDANIGETVLDTTAPRLTCIAADVKDVPREATVTVRDVTYSVTQIQPDGTGFAIVQLAHE